MVMVTIIAYMCLICAFDDDDVDDDNDDDDACSDYY